MSAFKPDPPPPKPVSLGLQVIGLEIFDNGVKIGEIASYAEASIPEIQLAFSLVNRNHQTDEASAA